MLPIFSIFVQSGKTINAFSLYSSRKEEEMFSENNGRITRNTCDVGFSTNYRVKKH
jgi:hypothetical protein